MPKTIKNRIQMIVKKSLLKKKGVIIHHNCFFTKIKFQGSAMIEPYCRFIGDPIIIIGKHFYCNAFCHFLGNITIGNDVNIGPQTVIWGRDHGIAKNQLMRTQPHSKQKITIGDDVWIGAHVTILKGVTISTGAVIGAGSVVTKDIPPFGIAIGNPAHVIKFRS
ncbi:MAG: acyltransferase [Patescibacteria group bacterium]